MKEKVLIRAFEKERRKNLFAEPGKHELIIVCDGLKPGFNIGKIFRTADAFSANSIHLINTPFFNTGPALGTMRHVPAKFYETFQESYQVLEEAGYQVYMLDPHTKSSLFNTELSKKTALVLGHEEFGFSFDPKDYGSIKKIAIPQFGHVESLNVSVAASVAMYEYVRQHASQE